MCIPFGLPQPSPWQGITAKAIFMANSRAQTCTPCRSMAKVQDEKLLTAKTIIMEAVDKMRMATPETFEARRGELEDAITRELNNVGSHVQEPVIGQKLDVSQGLEYVYMADIDIDGTTHSKIGTTTDLEARTRTILKDLMGTSRVRRVEICRAVPLPRKLALKVEKKVIRHVKPLRSGIAPYKHAMVRMHWKSLRVFQRAALRVIQDGCGEMPPLQVENL